MVAFSGSYNDLSYIPAPKYAVCSSSSSTVAKTASIVNFKLTFGTTVKIKFSYANSATSPTLNISSTGAKSIVYYVGSTVKTLTASDTWAAGETVEFVYNGSYWVIISSDQAFVHPNKTATNEHFSGNIASAQGAHSLRYYNNTLQYYDGGTWKTLNISKLLI